MTLIEQIMFLFTGTADSKITVGASLSHGLQSGVFFVLFFTLSESHTQRDL